MIRDDPTIRRWLRILIKAVDARLDDDEEYIEVFLCPNGIDSRTHNLLDEPVNSRSMITVYDAVRELMHLAQHRCDYTIHQIAISRHSYSIKTVDYLALESGHIEDLR